VALFVLGGDSNLLITDAGFSGLVLHVAIRGVVTVDALGQTGQRIFQVAAGEDWHHFVQRTVQDNCAGVECLAGIPGTVGGTLVQNVGGYGQEAASAIERLRAFDLAAHSFVEFSAAECGFDCRRSRFNAEDCGRYVMTRVDYLLTQGGAPTLRYADQQRAFPEGVQPTLAEMAEQFQRIADSSPMLPPRFPAGPGAENARLAKVPAAWLIEQTGFHKGYVAGLGSRILAAHSGAGQPRPSQRSRGSGPSPSDHSCFGNQVRNSSGDGISSDWLFPPQSVWDFAYTMKVC